jgi:hypothetical protein
MENRHGLAAAGMVTHANGTAERRASEIMLKAKSKAAGRRITAGEDPAYFISASPITSKARFGTESRIGGLESEPHCLQRSGAAAGSDTPAAFSRRCERMLYLTFIRPVSPPRCFPSGSLSWQLRRKMPKTGSGSVNVGHRSRWCPLSLSNAGMTGTFPAPRSLYVSSNTSSNTHGRSIGV